MTYLYPFIPWVRTRLPIRSLKCSERPPWLSHAPSSSGWDCGARQLSPSSFAVPKISPSIPPSPPTAPGAGMAGGVLLVIAPFVAYATKGATYHHYTDLSLTSLRTDRRPRIPGLIDCPLQQGHAGTYPCWTGRAGTPSALTTKARAYTEA